jgi:hypothetical protein
MEFKQPTIGDIIESEREMFLTADDRYGEYFTNASASNTLLNNFIKSVDDPGKFIFLVYLASVKKHHTLALFSTVRLHSVQAGMNLRQVIEAAAWATYAMAFKDKEKFYEDASGVVDVPERLRNERNFWLNQNFKEKSDVLKNLKNFINRSVAHVNLAYAYQNNFRFESLEQGFNTPFFDIEDKYRVKVDLWRSSHVAIELLDLFYVTNKKYQIVQFVDDFLEKHRILVKQNNKLKTEVMSSDRFKKAQKLG